MSWKIPLSEIYLENEEIDAVVDVLKSKWLTMGGVTKKFEEKFAEMMNVKYAFAVNNCTAALHLANLSLGISEGDEVICPALTFVASANASKYCGANVIFADSVSEDDWTIDPQDIERKITEKTKAIIVVHYAGFPCLMEEILKIAQKHNLKIIEDCAHSPFAWYKFSNNKKQALGSIGDIGCFSFFGNKNMTTGEGGMVTTNDDKIAEKIRLLRSHGMTTLTYDRHKGHANYYDVVTLGFNYRTDEIHSAIGLAQLEKINNWNEKRREVYKNYINEFKNKENVIIPFKNRDINQAVCHIMPIIVKQNYEEIKEKLKLAGIQTSKHYNLIPTFSAYKNSNFQSKISNIGNIMTLPMYPTLTLEEIKQIADFF